MKESVCLKELESVCLKELESFVAERWLKYEGITDQIQRMRQMKRFEDFFEIIIPKTWKLTKLLT